MKLIFSLSAGRTGTMYLAKLLADNLPNASVHHERLNHYHFGVEFPEISHLSQFNTFGNVAKVQDFWQQKLDGIVASGRDYYAETSHVLMKAGLVENAVKYAKDHQIHFVILTRDIFDTVVSYKLRNCFENLVSIWTWYLDPSYKRNIITLPDWHNKPRCATSIWYIHEIMTRAYYYRLKYQNTANVYFHEYDIKDLKKAQNVHKLLNQLGYDTELSNVKIPAKQNESKTRNITVEEQQYIRNMIKKFPIDHMLVAKEFMKQPTLDW